MQWMIVAQLLAQVDEGSVAQPGRITQLGWMFQSLGPIYGVLIPFCGLAVFLGALLVVVGSRRPSVSAAFLVWIPLPLLIGLVGAIHGTISICAVIARTTTPASPSELAAGISMTLFAALFGLLCTLPGYLVIAFGLLLRTIAWRGPQEVPQEQTTFG